MRQIKTISIKCDNEKTLELADMTELQGGLKERTDIDYDKIKLSIIKYGFSFPFYIWKSGKTNYILDGHGRFETLCRMQKDGYIIPPLPVFYIKAKDKAEAKQKLLRLNSAYGRMTKESVLEFAEDMEINFDEIALPDGEISFETAEDTEADFPDLKAGDRDTQCTMTFCLTSEQVEVVKEAIRNCNGITNKEGQNRNGTALAYICESFLSKE